MDFSQQPGPHPLGGLTWRSCGANRVALPVSLLYLCLLTYQGKRQPSCCHAVMDTTAPSLSSNTLSN